jgi:hypothetical protein
VKTGERCYASRGFSLHAATRIPAGDKDGLERLCRYVARPPLAAGRLTALSEDELLFRLKTPWSDGTTSLIFSPMELLEKIAALVPPPRVNLIRYHGVLAAHAKNREKIVPSKTPQEAGTKPVASKAYRQTFAALLARVFQIEIDKCPRCGGKMRIVAALTDPGPASVRRYLEGTGQSAEIPEIAAARAPPQLDLDFDYWKARRVGFPVEAKSTHRCILLKIKQIFKTVFCYDRNSL